MTQVDFDFLTRALFFSSFGPWEPLRGRWTNQGNQTPKIKVRLIIHSTFCSGLLLGHVFPSTDLRIGYYWNRKTFNYLLILQYKNFSKTATFRTFQSINFSEKFGLKNYFTRLLQNLISCFNYVYGWIIRYGESKF